MGYSSMNIRNVAVCGHSSSGKTTLMEGLLFFTKATNRLGKVDDSTSLLDFEPEEQQRKISIRSSIAPVFFADHKYNFIDTPGYADFIGEVYSTLSAVDSVLIVVDAISGVQVQTDKVWTIAEHLPKAFFINKLDKQDADFESALVNIKDFYPNANLAPIALPIGKSQELTGTVNLLDMKAYFFKDGKVAQEEVPTELKSKVEAYREQLMEAAAEGDDGILEKYLEEGTLSDEELVRALKISFSKGLVVPVFAGSGLHLVGLEVLLRGILSFFPSPLDREEVHVKAGDERKAVKPSPEGSLIAYVFKTTADPYVGKLNFMRVFSGSIKADSTVYNSNSKRKERVGHIYETRGKEQKEVSEISCGDIGTIPKLAETKTGDTLCVESSPVSYLPLEPPEPVFSVAVEPKTKGDEEKLSTSLSRLSEEDSTIRVYRDPESKQIIVSGLGDLHLEILIDTMKRKFNVDANLSEPKIPYRETIKTSSKAQGKYKRQSGGRGQYGDVWLEVEPREKGSGFEFVDKIVGGVVPKNFIPSVEKGVKEALLGGILAGYPVVDIRVSLYDGSHHSVDSSDMAFKIAGSLGFRNAAIQANPTILEPIVKLEVVIPEKYMGDVMGQLSGKRGKILGMESKGKYEVVKALVPLSEVMRYATELRSITHGEGSFSMEFSHYDEAPPDIQQKLIEAYKKEKEVGSQ